LKKIAREKELSDKKAPYSKRARKSMLLRARPAKTAILNLPKRLSSTTRASTIKKKRKIQMLPVPKKLSLATQTPLMALCMSWNQVKGSLARKSLRSVQSESL
jgi:hypothetical protein